MKTTRRKGDRFEAYVTKYALTSGVTRCLVEHLGNGHVRCVVPEKPIYCAALYHPGDWHATEDGAAARVREMIAAKRESIAKQMVRLDEIEKDPLGAAKVRESAS